MQWPMLGLAVLFALFGLLGLRDRDELASDESPAGVAGRKRRNRKGVLALLTAVDSRLSLSMSDATVDMRRRVIVEAVLACSGQVIRAARA
jgi:hypothetical protein